MFLEGKKGIIFGVANDRSIAWGIAQEASKNGAKIGFSYQGEVFKNRVTPLAQSLGSDFVHECDVGSDESVKAFFDEVKKHFGKIDFIVHSIAFANKDYLKGQYFNTPRDVFLQSMDISVYSLVLLSKYAKDVLNENGSIVTLSYYGAEKVVPNYNVMGVAKAALECSVKYLAKDFGEMQIRVNSISSGPVKTLAASGISDFKKMLNENAKISPLKRNVSLADVGKTAVYLLSDLSSGVTGENIHVDCGYSIMGSCLSEDE